MSEQEKPDNVERLVKGYEEMLHRASEMLKDVEKKTTPVLRETMEKAREKAVELNELTREEAERVSQYVQRDIEDAAEFIADTGEEFKSWLSFDWQLVNDRILDAFAGMADQTSEYLRNLAASARDATTYHAGEVAGPGALICTSCGYVIHSKKARRIPPCPNCQKTEFRRAKGGDDLAEESVDQGDVDGD